MRVRFKGEADGLPCEVFGQVFPAGEWVEVEGLALKLATNPMFDAEGHAGPFDHDGDGKAGGSAKPAGDVAALRAEYQTLVGKRPFPGWGADVLREKIAAASEPEPEPDPEEVDA